MADKPLLKVFPSNGQLEWVPGRAPAQQECTLRNTDGTKAVCFKVRTTNVGRYRVNPSQGIILANQSVTIGITLVAGGGDLAARKDRFLIQTAWSVDGNPMTKEAVAEFWKSPPPKENLSQYRLDAAVLQQVGHPRIEEGTPPVHDNEHASVARHAVETAERSMLLSSSPDLDGLVVDESHFAADTNSTVELERKLEPEPEVEQSNPSAEQVASLAKLVGTDTWKVWAGRKEGGDGFQLSDLGGALTNLRHTWQRKWREGTDVPPPNGKPCPICDDLEPTKDIQGKCWQTLFCGCTGNHPLMCFMYPFSNKLFLRECVLCLGWCICMCSVYVLRARLDVI